jgi:hypothetical protein
VKVGAVYMVRGGHLLRYRGLYSNTGPCLAFGPVTEEGPFDLPVGYSAAKEDVLYEVTVKDLPWLRDRQEQLLARKLPTEDVQYLIAELEHQTQM